MIKTAAFAQSAAAYVRAAVTKANADKNPYLTVAERAKLPMDLQENFDNHGAAQKNGRVVADKFVERFTDYVSLHVKRADKNGNGVLTKTEAKALPFDLRDNFENYANAMLASDLRAQLKSTQGRQTFAELVENQLTDPTTGVGYAWEPEANVGSMAWSFRSTEVGDDTRVVRIKGRELTIQSEMSGFTGKATIAGTTNQSLTAAIRRALKDLDAVADANRGV